MRKTTRVNNSYILKLSIKIFLIIYFRLNKYCNNNKIWDSLIVYVIKNTIF